ncbi:hypothetical protein OSSY52_06970 [Tepiditoga spiralis]|uniref:Uracil-DNA glycosylase-like domain-containing protein n=1 Tax=Tepiditoga spiralis TaxID=2108365 RepID=A0A7G1G5J5_9BACT|nr:hypothetical protein [Tepiditoga spiralis]BBE30556.1 hypothetical protein OSSY52_06970 [Tepiditoga spiralis]
MTIKTYIEINNKMKEIFFDVNSQEYKELLDKNLVKKNELNLKLFTKDKKVQDVWRYNYIPEKGVINNKTSDFNSKFNDKKIPLDIKNSIILLLESPHKDEYQKNNFIPIAPAQGATGRAIEKFKDRNSSKTLKYLTIEDLLKKTNIIEKSPILLVNPVQYQASLGSFTKKLNKNLRNNLWKSLFNELKNDFISRITIYKPLLIINGCTNDLKDEVNNCINTNKIINVPHPYNWSFGGIRNPIYLK